MVFTDSLKWSLEELQLLLFLFVFIFSTGGCNLQLHCFYLGNDLSAKSESLFIHHLCLMWQTPITSFISQHFLIMYLFYFIITYLNTHIEG